MKVVRYPQQEEKADLLSRPVMEASDIMDRVKPILEAVKEKGDTALKEFTERFDRVELTDLEVSYEEFEEAYSLVDQELKEAIQVAYNNIKRFHESQKASTAVVHTMNGVQCWRKSLPIEKVGLYIPGGTAPLFSTILMLGIPASLAGCKERILCTPPGTDGKINPAILYTAQLVGVDKVFKVGGAQAIAAMAYGTGSIPQVYKIFGPGNQYVTAAKQAVSQEGTAIDMPAGPSEVMVVADKTAPASFIAADLLAQAEHGIDSQVVLLTTEESLLPKVVVEIEQQLKNLPRADFARQSLANSRAILLKDDETMVEWMNDYAAEHLILSVENDEEWAEKVETAGSVFLGHYSPESIGDYASGTNHTLPTNGYARAYSGVSLDSFVKKVTFQRLSKTGIQTLGPYVEKMAIAENLQAHKNAVSVRLEQLGKEG